MGSSSGSLHTFRSPDSTKPRQPGPELTAYSSPVPAILVSQPPRTRESAESPTKDLQFLPAERDPRTRTIERALEAHLLIARSRAIRTMAPTVAVTKLPSSPPAEMPSSPKRKPPSKAPITPTIRSPTRPYPPPFIN